LKQAANVGVQTCFVNLIIFGRFWFIVSSRTLNMECDVREIKIRVKRLKTLLNFDNDKLVW